MHTKEILVHTPSQRITLGGSTRCVMLSIRGHFLEAIAVEGAQLAAAAEMDMKRPSSLEPMHVKRETRSSLLLDYARV